MNLLVVYPYFVDQGAAGHSLMFETLVGLAERGHTVTVVSGEGGYMQGAAPTSRPWWRRIVYSEQAGPVRVLRTLSFRSHQKGMVSRLLSYALLSLLNPIAVLMAGRADVALLSPPPLYPIFTSLLACRLRRIPAVTEVRDLWPGSIVQMGLMKNRWLIKLTAWMERVVYNGSREIVGLTEGIRQDIAGRGWPADHVHCLPCAVDSQGLAPSDELGQATRAAYGWQGHFVLMYFGALGEANNLPVLLRAAQRLQDVPAIRLVLVGDGFRRAWLQEQVQALGLKNVQVLPAVPKAHANRFLNAADACVVTLQDIEVFAGAIPTKLIEYMACAKPVVCGVRGEACRIVEEAEAGVCFEPDDDARLAQLVRQLRDDPQLAQRLGQAGRATVQQRFDREQRTARMESLLRQACNQAVTQSSPTRREWE